MESHRSVWLAAFGLIGAAATTLFAYALALQATDHSKHRPELLERPSMLAAVCLYVVCALIFVGILYDARWLPRGRLTRNAAAARNQWVANHLQAFSNGLAELQQGSAAEITAKILEIERWLRAEEPDLVHLFLSDVGIGGINAGDPPEKQELHKRSVALGMLKMTMQDRASTGT